MSYQWQKMVPAWQDKHPRFCDWDASPSSGPRLGQAAQVSSRCCCLPPAGDHKRRLHALLIWGCGPDKHPG